jgi:hypothetical protein
LDCGASNRAAIGGGGTYDSASSGLGSGVMVCMSLPAARGSVANDVFVKVLVAERFTEIPVCKIIDSS